jgi:hypothetical protein
MPARQLRSRNQVPAVDYFYSAAKRRSSGALWPIFAPALIRRLPRLRFHRRSTQIVLTRPNSSARLWSGSTQRHLEKIFLHFYRIPTIVLWLAAKSSGEMETLTTQLLT